MCNLRSFLVIAYCSFQYFSMGSALDVKHDLILALRSQTFENLRETFNRHALGTWNRLVQKKKGGKNVSTETPVHH